MKKSKIKNSILLSFLVISGACLPIILWEFGFRIEQLVSKGISPFQNPRDKWDPILGWTGKEHVFGNTGELHTLVIGDSFTEGLDVASDKMWFSYLPLPTDSRLIAYGGLGYGTYQETEVLKQYLAKYNSIARVVLQICSNDIINNDSILEQKTFIQRPPAPRPFLEDGKVVFKLPYEQPLYNFAFAYSRVAHRYIKKAQNKMAAEANQRKLHSVEFTITEQALRYEPFQQAVKKTEELLSKFVTLAGNREIIFVLVDDTPPYTAAIKSISNRLKIPLIIPRRKNPFPPEAMHKDGAHFNEYGNQLLGQAVSKFISTLETRMNRSNL